VASIGRVLESSTLVVTSKVLVEMKKPLASVVWAVRGY
jgi:hypothetical protein